MRGHHSFCIESKRMGESISRYVSFFELIAVIPDVAAKEPDDTATTTA